MGTHGRIIDAQLNSVEYVVDEESEAELESGGVVNTMKPNGNGTASVQQAIQLPRAEGLGLKLSSKDGQIEQLDALAKTGEFFPVALTLADGSVWTGPGQIEGPRKYNTKTGVMPITLVGEQNWVRQ